MGLTFLSSSKVTREVLGQPVDFYPITVYQLFQLRKIGKTVTKAVAVLLGGNSGTKDTKKKETYDKAAAGEMPAMQSENETRAMDPRLYETIHLHRQAAIDDVIDTLMQDESMGILCDVIHDSMRSKDKPKDTAGKIKFMQDITGDALTQILLGILEANKSMFDPLGQWGKAALERLKENVAPGMSSRRTTTTTGT